MSTKRSAVPFLRDLGLVLASFVVLLALENIVVGVGYRDQFVGSWEMASARRFLSPIALAAYLPIAALTVALGRLIAARRASLVGLVFAVFGGAVAFGISSGRHFASWALRAPFIVVAALAAGAVAWIVTKRVPLERPRSLAVAGALVGAGAWLADAFVLPRLYPAFHWALLAITLLAWGATVLPIRELRPSRWAAVGIALLAIFSVGWSLHAARSVSGDDNLRRVMLERAPLLGRAVRIASELAPPPPMDEAAAETTLTSLRDRPGARSLDWTGHDVILVTIDALRADHLSAYGYARPTTPNIDRLAARGARFDRAYCPTPHTSYSIASMMTGKYMRPLLALGAGEESETWAGYMRRYGYRTGAFYPPAVFFIDEHRFRKMHESGLGFEYRKEEFAARPLRREQIQRYLGDAPKDKPLFLWVHLFEPHEPYEMHSEHPFSGRPAVDAYDSEIAEADALVGDIVSLVEKKRGQDSVFIVSADHGEEHGDHGGRYHGTTVYEEQVRVPLVVVGPGIEPRVVSAPVQTIDLLPTTLAALEVPLPARIRGRDLGPLLVGRAPAGDEGLAFAETDDYTLVARKSDRLVCARKIASCTLFDIAADPAESHAVTDRPVREKELRGLTAALERENGRVEASDLPEALRRGLQGDREAAEDVAPLLDDARPEIRRTAARCGFRLKAEAMSPQLRRALARDEDAEVRRWCALALVRLGQNDGASASVDATLTTGNAAERAAAALALAERGDPRGEGELIARFRTAFGEAATEPGELDEARELLAAFAKLRSRAAVPVLTRALADIRLRPYVVETLAAIGDPKARPALLAAFVEERYLHVRPLEAKALLALGAKEELYAPLMRFAGTPEPMVEAVTIAREAKLLTVERGGKSWDKAEPSVFASLRVRSQAQAQGGGARLLVLAAGPGPLTGSVGEERLPEMQPFSGHLYVIEAGDRKENPVEVHLEHPVGILGTWLVRHAPEIPPPPPRLPAGDLDAGTREGGL